MTRTIDIASLNQILDTDPENIGTPNFALRMAKPTGRTFEDGIVEEWEAVFHWWEDGKLYRVTYRKAGAYYRVNVGEDFGPFDHLRGAKTVECVEVVARRKILTVYENPGTRLAEGTRVFTVKPDPKDEATDWLPKALASRRWGVEGAIVTHHDSHGLTYEVRHSDGTIGHYEPHELLEMG